jgi:hypothetical protein
MGKVKFGKMVEIIGNFTNKTPGTPGQILQRPTEEIKVEVKKSKHFTSLQ